MELDKFKNLKLNLEPIKSFQMPEGFMSQVNESVNEMNRQADAISNLKQLEKEEERRYKTEVLQVLQGIENNTASIVGIIDLLQYNNEKQDEIIELLTEILSVGAAATQKEVESRYKKAFKKINDLGTGVKSMQILTGVLTTVYNTAIVYLTNKP